MNWFRLYAVTRVDATHWTDSQIEDFIMHGYLVRPYRPGTPFSRLYMVRYHYTAI